MAAHLSHKLVEAVELQCQQGKLLTAIQGLVIEGISPRTAAQWLAEGHTLIGKGKRYDYADCRTPDCPGCVAMDPDGKGAKGRAALERTMREDNGPECAECGQRQWVCPTLREEWCIRLARLDARGTTEILGKASRSLENVLDMTIGPATQPGIVSSQVKAATFLLERLDPRFSSKQQVTHSGGVHVTAGPSFAMGLSDAQLERLNPQALMHLQAISEYQTLLDAEARKVIEAALGGEVYEPRLPFDLPALAASFAE